MKSEGNKFSMTFSTTSQSTNGTQDTMGSSISCDRKNCSIKSSKNGKVLSEKDIPTKRIFQAITHLHQNLERVGAIDRGELPLPKLVEAIQQLPSHMSNEILFNQPEGLDSTISDGSLDFEPELPLIAPQPIPISKLKDLIAKQQAMNDKSSHKLVSNQKSKSKTKTPDIHSSSHSAILHSVSEPDSKSSSISDSKSVSSSDSKSVSSSDDKSSSDNKSGKEDKSVSSSDSVSTTSSDSKSGKEDNSVSSSDSKTITSSHSKSEKEDKSDSSSDSNSSSDKDSKLKTDSSSL